MANTIESEILGNKRCQQLTDAEEKLAKLVALGKEPADLLITNIQLLDLINGGIEQTSIAISGRTIAGVGEEYNNAKAKEVFDGRGLFITPGFIDGHLHIESSLMHPFEFERVSLPIGTTTAICDPHEITNVLNTEGFEWFLRCSEKMALNLFVQVSSCVPAIRGFETNGGEFPGLAMKKYKGHPNVLGLAEMMNFPGVINSDPEVMEKIRQYRDMNLDGHCPLLRGRELNAYLISGIQNCHETVTADEGMEKLKKGMGLIIREGSVAKNLGALAPLVSEFNSTQCLLCTDDRNPYEIFHEGHINYLIKLLINKIGLPAHLAYRLATFSAAKHFGLKRLGLVAPGHIADLVILSDLANVAIKDVLIGGKFVSKLSLKDSVEKKYRESRPPEQNSIKRKKCQASDFSQELKKGYYNVIEVIPNEIITKHLKVFYDGKKFSEDDVKKIVIMERYGKNLRPSIGLVKGFAIEQGAIASSVAHDAHNLIAIGDNEDDIALAINHLIDSGGGFCVSSKGKILASLALPLAGLMSPNKAEDIVKDLEDLKDAQKRVGIVLDGPFLQMAFIALPVIPTLKITDKGLVDVTKFQFVDLYVGEKLT